MHALRGKEHVEWDNPYDVGMTGLIGFSSGYHAMQSLRHAADAGHRLPLPAVLSGASAQIAQIDIRGENIGRRAPVDLGIVGEVAADTAMRCCRS